MERVFSSFSLPMVTSMLGSTRQASSEAMLASLKQEEQAILDDAVASGKDDCVEAVDVQLGQVLHLHRSLTVTEASGFHHHVPM
ncbi:hypothetical protein EYF80_003186 [Liparis tanakae]|uniref:Uncharacterized protein n=1 Tax=Liparis tanakae TaxID=230148 RepID=A0A4Z2J880_9TELE|nr:hypothetical protein EYF80_003186 [Liparis tanakae]